VLVHLVKAELLRLSVLDELVRHNDKVVMGDGGVERWKKSKLDRSIGHHLQRDWRFNVGRSYRQHNKLVVQLTNDGINDVIYDMI